MAQTLVQKSVLDSSGNEIPMPFFQESVTGSNFPAVQIVPGDLGGCSVTHLIAAATTNATLVKSTPGQVYGFSLFHINDAPIYVTFYNSSSAPTVDTTAIFMKFGCPAAGTAALGNEITRRFGEGIAFSTGIAYAIHKGITTSTACDASEVLFTLWYK